MSTLRREADASKFHFGGCPGALGKLASKCMFRTLLGASWPGVHKHAPEDDFPSFLDRGLAGSRKL